MMNAAERQEMAELTAFLRHEAIRHGDDEGQGDDEGMLRLAELIDLALNDLETLSDNERTTP